MTTLPRRAADELLAHLANCAQCKMSKVYKGGTPKCPTGQELVKATLSERHGEVAA